MELKKLLKKDVSNLTSVKVALVGDTATQLLAIAIKGTGIERGLNINLFEAEFNQVERQFLDAKSDIYTFNPDFIVIFQSTHNLLLKYNKLSLENQLTLANERIRFIRTICKSSKSKIIYYNYSEIDDSVFGSYANKMESSFLYQVRKLNYELMKITKTYSNLYVCDISSIQNKLGRDTMFDSSIYITSAMVLSIESLPYMASRTVDIICSIIGKFKKCLILDLDNTLWGGIIGDDGLEKIQIGSSIGIGKAYTEIQQWVKKLKSRGIIIAVCSKNTESIAKEPFEKHPDMVLRMDDISVFMANWENKADNIRQIQEILNIGFDSFVFLDDNSFERNFVSENIPQITVPQLPEDPADYLEFLYSLNLFETPSISEADLSRTKQYQVEAQRSQDQKKFTSQDDFLRNLEMVSDIQQFNNYNIPRVSQLSQRSNQFNLRTIRYSDTDLGQMLTDSSYHCFSFTLEDKYGDNGLITAIILKMKSTEILFIESWFMSCRVINRGMENFVLNKLVEYAKGKGFKYFLGEYIPTIKNKLVENHYTNLGFEPSENGSMFTLNIEVYENKECYINKKI